MTQIIDFEAEREKRKPHFTGPVRCLECKHGWTGVWPAETGVEDLECPSCGLFKGVSEGTVRPKEGLPVFTCFRCSAQCQHFKIVPGPIAVCMYCGFEHDISELTEY